jgi:type IV secretion system protein VirD4
VIHQEGSEGRPWSAISENSTWISAAGTGGARRLPNGRVAPHHPDAARTGGQAHLSLFRDPILAANTAASDFSPLDLVDADRPVALYLTLSPAELNRLRGPIRILLNQLCRALTERLDFQPGSSRPGAPRRPAPWLPAC